MAEEKTTIQLKEPNIYQRIQKTRMELTELNLKKTGENNFSHYKYYELGDFLPSLNRLMNENGIMTRFVLQKDRAVLEIFNTDKPEEKEVFYTPVASSEVKGTTAIQQLGAQITYLRRYLLMTAFEIAESDAVDADHKEEKGKKIDDITMDEIQDVDNLKDLAKVCKKLQDKLGPDFRDSLVREYTRRKKEIEEAEAEKLNEDVDKGLEQKK